MNTDIKERINIQLPSHKYPENFYNIRADLPEDIPFPKETESGKGTMENLKKIIPTSCLEQELSLQRNIPIPGEILELLMRAGRPRPLFRAKGLENLLKTPAKLFYKAEFYSPTGSHKVNTALAQAYYANKEGFSRMSTETGAGQWGTAVAYACSLVGLESRVFWVRRGYEEKPDRRSFIRLFGGEVLASPSTLTRSGKKLLDKNPEHPGSLSIAISEGVEEALENDDTIYSFGSLFNYVLLHHTVIGLEAREQMRIAGDYPDIVISCVGGGSNFAGLAFPFYGEVFRNENEKPMDFIAAQSEAAPNLEGEYRYDHSDHAGMTPMTMMYTLGNTYDIAPLNAYGLRFHCAAPLVSLLRKHGMLKVMKYPADEKDIYEAASMFTASEGFLVAPESAYSIRAAVDKAIECRNTGENKTILFNISGHGFLDIPGYREMLKIK